MEKIKYLRLSITDRCNLGCIYCKPAGRDYFIPHDKIMRYEEMTRAVRILNSFGIERVRITGGEPLVRRDVEELVRILKETASLKEISMTTNGVLLKEKLTALLKNGLDRINISLNTLKKDKYAIITGSDRFDEVRESIKEALAAPQLILKINVVILKGINDDEIEDFAAFTIENKAGVRFIEYVPMKGSRQNLEYIPSSIVKQRITKRLGLLIPAEANGGGPAINYRINGAKGQLGFISSRTENFCSSCNRLRMNCEGRIYPCLFSPLSIDLRKMLREGMSEDEIRRHIEGLLYRKTEFSKKDAEIHKVEMSAIGG